jgi:hypothetical protein
MRNLAVFDSDNNSPIPDGVLFAKKDAAAFLTIEVRFLEYYIAAGMIRTVRLGRAVRIHLTAITFCAVAVSKGTVGLTMVSGTI